MKALVALAMAVGCVLVFQGLTSASAKRRRPGARRDLIRRIGTAWGLGALGFLVASGTTRSLVAALAAAGLAAWLPLSMAASRRRRQQGAVQEAWPDALASIVSGARAGLALAGACQALADRGPAPLRSGWGSFAGTYRASSSFERAIEQMAETLADPIADRVAVTLSMAHRVGGTELIQILETLATSIRAEVAARRDIEARWSWNVTAARLSAAAPWLVLLLMSSRPESAAAYDTPLGAFAIGGGAIATVIGYQLMLRAARLPQQRRLRL